MPNSKGRSGEDGICGDPLPGDQALHKHALLSQCLQAMSPVLAHVTNRSEPCTPNDAMLADKRTPVVC